MSPLLSNLYMDKFDQFMEKHILPAYNFGGRRAENKAYKVLCNQVEKHMRHHDWKTVKELNKQRQSMPSKDALDPAFKRLYYIRYADDWLLGISGPKQDAVKVKEQIKTFLVSELNLTLSEEKTLITHAKTEKARFLGYDIHVLHQDTKHDKRGQRSINGMIGLRVPDDKVKDKARQYKKSGKPTHRKERTINSDLLPTGKVFSIRSQLIDRLLKDTCELCGSSGAVEMHHVKKLKDLKSNGRKEKPEWMKRMVAMRRKTLAVCRECHAKIHSGNYDGKKVISANVG